MPIIKIPAGATLSGLARQYGTTIAELMKANPTIKDPNLIYAGASLVIPEKTTAPVVPIQPVTPPKPITPVVAPVTPAQPVAPAQSIIQIPAGATLSGLARQYGTTTTELMKANPTIRDPNLIYAGAPLVIPGKTTAPVVPAQPVAPIQQTETQRVMAEIAEKKKKVEELTGIIKRAQAAGLAPTEEIPAWVIEAKTPEEVAKMVKPERIKELEKTAFAPLSKTFDEIFTAKYEAGKYGEIKKQIDELTAKIDQKKRDLLIAEEGISENPWLSEAGRLGRIKKLYDMAQKEIEILSEEKKSLIEQYKIGVEKIERATERELKKWEAERGLRQKELEYLTKGKDEILSVSELKAINAGLPVNQQLPYGTTKSEAIAMGVVPKMAIGGVPKTTEKKLKPQKEAAYYQIKQRAAQLFADGMTADEYRQVQTELTTYGLGEYLDDFDKWIRDMGYLTMETQKELGIPGEIPTKITEDFFQKLITDDYINNLSNAEAQKLKKDIGIKGRLWTSVKTELKNNKDKIIEAYKKYVKRQREFGFSDKEILKELFKK